MSTLFDQPEIKVKISLLIFVHYFAFHYILKLNNSFVNEVSLTSGQAGVHLCS